MNKSPRCGSAWKVDTRLQISLVRDPQVGSIGTLEQGPEDSWQPGISARRRNGPVWPDPPTSAIKRLRTTPPLGFQQCMSSSLETGSWLGHGRRTS
ncbi:uncharacterized protein LOC141550900 isoform X2 [Sminthopsis crassicaudata]|uniref:uncharacterized protein LOC141550900 isoform X2 n=1 Tax=Sminthopsis crassicaudata TaxID=9301 RepID=UPI003D696739